MGQLGRVVTLGPQDVPAIQALFQRCAAFFQLVSGAPPRPDEAEDWVLRDNAPGKAPGDKALFGLLDDEERLIGAVDVVRDHPEPGQYWIGTMVLEPTIRGVGLGGWFHVEVLAWIRAQGARCVGLCVQRQNERALRFWERAGYVETGRATQRLGERENEVIRMRLEL
jgi:RimJ/RimL family protein N-acetyltransferase